MKIAVTYDNGQIFQHFGHTENFKVYEIEAGKVIDSKVIPAIGSGHDTLAAMLVMEDVNLLICGGMGQGAQDALAMAGIEVITGITGDADEAIEACLRGELASAGVNCDHHGEDHDCGDHCGGGCGGCGGGCHSAYVPPFDGPNVGKKVKVHYRGTFEDGVQFDSSYDRGEPLEFVCGTGMMIVGFDAAVASMEQGDIVDVTLTPDLAYGEINPKLIFSFKIAEMQGAEECEVGQQVYLYNQMGQPVPVRVMAKDEENITFDANSEMAGKTLNFRIELVEICE